MKSSVYNEITINKFVYKKESINMKKRNIRVLQKNSIENTVDLLRMESTRVGCGAFQGTGAHKNRKKDKKTEKN